MHQDPNTNEIERSVTTNLDVLRQDAAMACNINPQTADVTQAEVTEQGELRLYISGEQL